MSFSDMIAALFADPALSKAAFYEPQGSAGFDVRVIARLPDAVADFGETRLQALTALFDVRSADVPEPQTGDRLTCEGITYVVQAEPRADRERLVWTLDTRPA